MVQRGVIQIYKYILLYYEAISISTHGFFVEVEHGRAEKFFSLLKNLINIRASVRWRGVVEIGHSWVDCCTLLSRSLLSMARMTALSLLLLPSLITSSPF